MDNLIKIIKEEVQKAFENNIKGQDFFYTIQKDIPYFKDFKLEKYGFSNNNTEIWRFERNYKKCNFIAIIKHQYKKDDWYLKISMTGVLKQKGKIELETKYNYNEFKILVNNKLSNNLLWDFNGFESDIDYVQNNEIIQQIEELLKNKNKLIQTQNSYFNELKKIYDIANKYNLHTQQKKLLDELLSEFNDNRMKIIFVLNKTSNLDYYLDMEKQPHITHLNEIRNLIKKTILKEYEEAFEDIVFEKPTELLNMIANNEKIKFTLLPKNPYNKAIQEFVRYGEFMRFPTSLIFKWKNIILENIAKLNALTEIHGHSSNFPFDAFLDIFDYNRETGKDNDGEFSKWCKIKYEETGDKDYIKKYDFASIYEFLDEVKHIDDYTPQFSNGHHVFSDYATKPLLKLGLELEQKNTPEEIIVVINKILDVVHRRSDIAEIFIEGGSKTLNYISN